MPNLVESMLNRHLPQRSDGYRYRMLEGGISSEAYRVEPVTCTGSRRPLVLTIFRDPSTWWNVEVEELIREIIQGDDEVFIPKIYCSGIDTVDNHSFAFLLREYVTGTDLDTFLESELGGKYRSENIDELAGDLGYRLAVLHQHRTPIYGLLGRDHDNRFTGWRDYILSELKRESQILKHIRPTRRIGVVSAGDIIETFPKLDKVIDKHLQSCLFDVSPPYLGHGDARFANFIVDPQEAGPWRMKAMIDLTEVVGGDPEIDIAFIENWLHFSEYKSDFYKHAGAFKHGYSKARRISSQYAQRRTVYHILRSLAYLRTVFGFNPQEFLGKNPRNQEYVIKHAQILRSLGEGKSLEDLKIFSLV